MADTNYERGEMEIDGHEETFSGFMSYSAYGGAAIAVAVLVPILMFGVNLSQFLSFFIAVSLGFVIGAVMKFGLRWYVSLTATAFVLGLVIGLMRMFIG